MSEEENKALVWRLVEEFFHWRDFAVLDELLAPDYVYRSGALAWQPEQIRGPEVYRRGLAVWWNAFPDLSYTVDQTIVEGDKVVTLYTVSGTHLGDFPWGPGGVTIKPTGRRLSASSIAVVRISGGKIVEEWESIPMESWWQQLGAVPSHPR